MKKFILLCFIFLFLAPFVFAVKTEITQINVEDNNLNIIYPKSFYHPQSVSFNLSFDVLNSSLAKYNSSQADCSFISVDNIGEIVCRGSLIYSSSLGYWYYPINYSNSAKLGTYNYYVYCNATNGENGFISSDYYITSTGEDITEFVGLNNIALIIGVGVVSLIFFFIAFQLDNDHFLLKLIFIFAGLLTLIIIPTVLFNNFHLAGVRLLKNITWVFRIFVTYICIYLFWHWVKKSNSLMKLIERFKNKFSK